MCIAEGFATSATTHQATGYPVVIACNAGNLEPVAKAMRQKFPSLSIIIYADDATETEGIAASPRRRHRWCQPAHWRAFCR